MSVTVLRAKVETRAAKEVEELRREIVALIMQYDSLRGWQGEGLRNAVASAIATKFGAMFDDYAAEYAEAYGIGTKRAEKELPQDVRGLTFLRADVSTFNNITRNAFARVAQNVRTDVLNILERATVGEESEGAKEKVIRQIGSAPESGVFRTAMAQARGVPSHEVEVVEMRGYLDRINEGKRQQTALIQQGQVEESVKKKIDAGKRPLVMKVWLHSDQSLQPRMNHILMSGKAVPEDMTFRLRGRDGVDYITSAPKDTNLPIGETANCRCTVYTETLWVTEEQERGIRQQAAITGGFDTFNEYKK